MFYVDRQSLVFSAAVLLCTCAAFQYKIRKEALVGLGQIYRRCCENDMPDDMKRVSWIRNKVLHAYYHNAVDDKYLPTLSMSDVSDYCCQMLYFIVGCLLIVPHSYMVF